MLPPPYDGNDRREHTSCCQGIWDCWGKLFASGQNAHNSRFCDELDLGINVSSHDKGLSDTIHGGRAPMILRSDSAHFKYASPRSPKQLVEACDETVNDGVKHFGDRVKSLKRARSNSIVEIPGSEDSSNISMVAKIEELGLTGKWRIPSKAREELESFFQVDTPTLLKRLTLIAQHLAVPVISVFHVGAVALGASGDVYMGPNLEMCSGLYTSNVCGFHYTIHAEVAAIICAFSHGERHLSCIYISTVPCGHCRQFMTELPDYRELLIWAPQFHRATKLGALLPYSFGPVDLGKSTTLLTVEEPNPVSFAADSEARSLDPSMADEVELTSQKAYAPYTMSYAASVLRLANGEYCRGPCVESVAFNPSVTPLSVALVALFSQGGKVEDIVAACLAEDPSAPIAYLGSDRALLAAVAPWVTLWLIPLARKELEETTSASSKNGSMN